MSLFSSAKELLARTTILGVLAILGGITFAGLGATGCKAKADRWADAAAAAESAAANSPTVERQESGSFNRFFPADAGEGTKRVFTSDREGYAEAKMTKDGEDVALLAITDLLGKDGDLKKYEEPKERLGDYPIATFGKNKTMILVHRRYQVSASSATLDHEARKNLLSKFDLGGLAAL